MPRDRFKELPGQSKCTVQCERCIARERIAELEEESDRAVTQSLQACDPNFHSSSDIESNDDPFSMDAETVKYDSEGEKTPVPGHHSPPRFLPTHRTRKSPPERKRS